MIHSRRAGDHGQPGAKPSPRRIVGFEQPEIAGTEADEHVLGRIQDVFLAQPECRERAPNYSIYERRRRGNERVPRSLVPGGERLQVDLIEFRHACVVPWARPGFVRGPRPPCSLTGFVANSGPATVAPSIGER